MKREAMTVPFESSRPLVGLLHNPAVPEVVRYAGDLIQCLEVIPDRLWYDFGVGRPVGARFHHAYEAVDTLRRCLEGRVAIGHGIGLSLPSAMPLDGALLDEVVSLHQDLQFAWYSEHLSMFLTPNGSVPNAQAGLGLPVLYDEATKKILKQKLTVMRAALGCPVLLENGAQFTPVPDPDVEEPEFLNRLNAGGDSGLLLDLHNLYVNERNGTMSADRYLRALDLSAVAEMHLAGGDELAGFYTDSHSRLTPAVVWQWAHDVAPRCPNLRAIVFEFHESYFSRFGVQGLAQELERAWVLAEKCASSARIADAG